MSPRTYSYWEIAAGARLPVEVTTKVALPSECVDILIVGAGFCGSWLAYFLKKNNPKAQIAILERDFFNLGASSRNAGFLSCGNVSEWLADSKDFTWEETLLTLKARIEGINLIKAELGSQPSWMNCGSADLDPITDEKLDFMERLNQGLCSNGYPPFFDRRTIYVGGRSVPVLFNSFDCEVNPCDLLLSLHKILGDLGVPIYRQVRITKMGGGEALALINNHSHRIQYGYAYLCTNAFAKNLNERTPVEPARGQIVVTSPCLTSTTHCLGFLKSGYDYFRFIGKRVLVGGGRMAFKTKESTDQLDVTSEIKDCLLILAAEVIGHNDFKVDYHWSGIMGLRKGKHASIYDLQKRFTIDSKTEEVAGFGGWGVTLTPYVTRNLANEWT